MSKMRKHPKKTVGGLVAHMQAMMLFYQYPYISQGMADMLESELEWYIETRVKPEKKSK